MQAVRGLRFDVHLVHPLKIASTEVIVVISKLR